jgi:hypothetical protein
VEELDFLGHPQSTAGATPLSGSLQVIVDFPRPHTVKDLQLFLGMANFYCRFLPKITQILVPLTNLLKGKDLPKVSRGRSGMTPLLQRMWCTRGRMCHWLWTPMPPTRTLVVCCNNR